MAWDAGSITSASPWAALSTKLKNLVGGTGVENWSFVENVPAGTLQGTSGSALFSLDVFRCRGATTLYKRCTQGNLANSVNTTDATSFVHTLFAAPIANQFITVCVVNTKATAADDPTSVTLDGSNAPTFTKIKSQASGAATPLLKMTLWIGKSGGSAPTGTNLTVSYGATQTGCMVIMDQWDGCDVTLGATSVDATGAAQIGIQVVGANGTSTTTHSATLGTMLGAQSIAVSWAAQTASATTYTLEAGWTGLAADIALSTPTAHMRGMFRPYQDDLTPTFTSGGAPTDWSCIALEFQRTTAATTVTSPNSAGQDWYFVIEIPVPDGAVTSSINACEDYDGNKLFNRMPPSPTNTNPVGIGNQGWRMDTLCPYGGTVNGNVQYTGIQRIAHQVLNTSGFNYWIKLTPSLVMIATRVSAAEATNGAVLLDSFVTNQTDLALLSFSMASVGSYSRLPGVTTSGNSNMWGNYAYAWTYPVSSSAITTNAANSQDKWSSNKIHAARAVSAHLAGQTTAFVLTLGWIRGLWPVDVLVINQGGTVQLGDTMTISGNTWTVIGKGQPGPSGIALHYLVRAT